MRLAVADTAVTGSGGVVGARGGRCGSCSHRFLELPAGRGHPGSVRPARRQAAQLLQTGGADAQAGAGVQDVDAVHGGALPWRAAPQGSPRRAPGGGQSNLLAAAGSGTPAAQGAAGVGPPLLDAALQLPLHVWSLRRRAPGWLPRSRLLHPLQLVVPPLPPLVGSCCCLAPCQAPKSQRFTFFYERILAKLLGDDTFALPFWNWDNNQESDAYNPASMAAGKYCNEAGGGRHPPNIIPFFYRQPDKYPGLFHQQRDARHMPGKDPLTVDVIWANVYNHKPAKGALETAAANRAEIKKRLVDSTAGGDLKWFLSHPWREGEVLTGPPDSLNTFEGCVHTAVHLWVGSGKHFFLDMGDSSSAVNDPLCFAHHANVDRIWNARLALDGHKNYDDPDFLDAAFYFYDENGEIVRVTVAESLDSDLLNYTYQQVENPWIPSEAVSSRQVSSAPILHTQPQNSNLVSQS